MQCPGNGILTPPATDRMRAAPSRTRPTTDAATAAHSYFLARIVFILAAASFNAASTLA
jgi:hypothetical protein